MLIKHVYKADSINIGYDKINETFQTLSAKLENTQCKEFYVTDLNFKLEELIQLYKMMKRFPSTKFIYIDHHDYNKKQIIVLKRMKELQNVEVRHNIKMCATLLTYKYLGIQDKKIKFYVTVVNAYDIWLVDSKFHDLGIDLNNYFWFLKARAFSYAFRNFSLKNQKFLDKSKQIRKQSREHFNKLENDHLCFSDNNIRVVFTDEYLGMVNSFYKEDIIIIGTSYGRISVRIDDKIDDSIANNMKNTVVKTLETSPFFVSGGGHNHAFGLTFSDNVANNYEIILDLMKHVFKVIEDIPRSL